MWITKFLKRNLTVIVVGFVLVVLTHLLTIMSSLTSTYNVFRNFKESKTTGFIYNSIKNVEEKEINSEKSETREIITGTDLITTELSVDFDNPETNTTEVSDRKEISGADPSIVHIHNIQDYPNVIKDIVDDNIEDFSILFFGIEASRLLLGYQDCCGRSLATGTRLTSGKNSEPIVSTESNSSLRPIVSVGRYGKGRFTYTPFVISPSATDFANDELVRNIVKWTSYLNIHAYIAICAEATETEMFHRSLENQEFYTFSDIANCSSNKNLGNVTFLKKYNLLFLNDHQVKTDDEVGALRDYVASGGGLILGSNPWTYNSDQMLFANKTLRALGGVTLIINTELKPFIITSSPLGQVMKCKHPHPPFNNFNLTKEKLMEMLCK